MEHKNAIGSAMNMSIRSRTIKTALKRKINNSDILGFKMESMRLFSVDGSNSLCNKIVNHKI